MLVADWKEDAVFILYRILLPGCRSVVKSSFFGQSNYTCLLGAICCFQSLVDRCFKTPMSLYQVGSSALERKDDY